MVKSEKVTPPIWSGLTRPPVPDDYVHRNKLESALEDRRKYPIVVVSAPAGYGKSTQISHWVEQTGTPCVWISLDDFHDDLGAFLSLLEAGLKSWSPTTAELLRKIGNTANLPSVNHIADAVATNINAVGKELVLVFDDYHQIQNAAIHLMVESILVRMPSSLRIAILTRRTPPLALSRLRSRNLVLDIRMQDLQFDRSETQALVNTAIDSVIEAKTLNNIHELTEGWPTGLRMLLLSLEAKNDVREYLANFEGRIWQIQDYLLEEVMNQLPEGIADRIYKTAILDRFSEDLIDAMLPAEGEDDPSGQEILRLIREKGLFCIPLDERAEWFRYHHLFQDVLLTRCKSLVTNEDMKDLYLRAAAWFDSVGDIEESMRYCLKAGDFRLAEDIIFRHGRVLNERHDSTRIDRLLKMLPTAVLERNIDLLALLGWNANRLGRITQMVDVIQLAEKRYSEIGVSKADDNNWLGQICAIRSLPEAHVGDFKTALASSKKALELLPSNFAFERAETTMVQGLILQMMGDNAAGRDWLYHALDSFGTESDRIRSRMLIGLCYMNWMNGDLHDMQHHAKSLLALGRSADLQYSLVHACAFSGAALYQLNDLDAAADVVQSVTAEKWWPHQRSYSSCVQIMSLIYAIRGEHSHALALSEVLVEESLELGSTYYLPEVEALQAELAYARGDLSAATHWALECEPGQLTAEIGFSVPALIAARILIQVNSDDAHQKADAILQKHRGFYESTYNKRFLSETLALQAVLRSKYGKIDDAMELLGRAVRQAEVGGFIRLFVDQGPSIIPLLNRLELKEQQLEYVGTILAGFAHDGGEQQSDNAAKQSQHENAGLLEPLSKRESEVLELLARRLTNKEIGERLFISPDTVKRHAHNIFAKLNVSSRREARAKAVGLGIVSD